VDAAPPLVPVLLQLLSGRSGSTLLMQLLGTSDEVVFDREYPFENRYLPYLVHLLDPLGQEHDPARHPSQLDLLRRPEGRYGPPPFAVGLDRRALQEVTFRHAWDAFSEVARRALPRSRYYVEKAFGDYSLPERAGLGPWYLQLLRDPRDIFTSIRAFDEKRGSYGFGRRPLQDEVEYLEEWIEKVRVQSTDLARAQASGAPVLVVRYEDLVTDLDAVARRVGAWLGVDLDARVVEAQRAALAHHMTSEDPIASVGRWRSELPRAYSERIERGLHAELRAHGY
jgi:hypothetical protein